MGIRFVTGRAGSGKTRWCFDRIVHAMRDQPLGAPIFWILPRQATFAAERDLTAGMGAFTRARILSFDELVREAVAGCGGGALPLIDASGRQMILGLLLRQSREALGYFGQVQRQSALAVRLDAMFSEFERAGHDDPDQVVSAIEQADPGDVESQALLLKLRDVALLYKQYQAYLGNDRLDQHRRIEQVVRSLDHWRDLNGATVFIDGFLEFAEHERKLIVGMAKRVADLSVTLLLDPSSRLLVDPHAMPDELGVFHRTECTFRKLYFAFSQENVLLDQTVKLTHADRFKQPALRVLERVAFDEQPVSTPAQGAIRLIESADRRAEVESAARVVRQKLMEGYRLREIGILARDLQDYQELIEASFREHEIPFFIDRRRKVMHHPLVQFARSALLVARDRWPHEAMVTILKSGLSGLTLAESDSLLQFVQANRVRGVMWADANPWSVQSRKAFEEDTTETADDTVFQPHIAEQLRRRIVEPFQSFVQRLNTDASLPVRQIVVELFQLFERIGVRKYLGQWIDEARSVGRYELAGEHEQVWAETIELFDRMVDLIGDEVVSLDVFLDVLDSGLEQFDLALTPPTVDQVLVGQVERSRAGIKVAICVGMNDGQFPRGSQEDSIFVDGERRLLGARNIEIGQDSERKLLDENLFGYLALTRASHALVLIRSIAADDRRDVAPSIFWRRVHEVFADIVIERDGTPSAEHIATPRQLVTGLMRWVRSEQSDDPMWPALYQWLARYPFNADAIDRTRHLAWRALSENNIATLRPATVQIMFPSPLQADARQLEEFATCPHQHFLKHGLKLAPELEDDATAGDISQICHQVLRQIASDLIRRRLTWDQLDQAATDQLIQSASADAAIRLRDKLLLSSARFRHVLARINFMLSQMIRTQQAIARRGRFAVSHAAVWYGYEKSRLKPLSIDTPHGHQLHLRGKVDRIDVTADGVSVIDYRMSSNRFDDTRLHAGLTVQPLADLLAIAERGEKLLGKPVRPAGVVHLPIVRRHQEVKHPDEAIRSDDDRFDLRAKVRGLINAGFLDDYDVTIKESGSSDAYSAGITKTGEIRKNSDIVTEVELTALLEVVRGKLGELADGIMEGVIDVRPYKIGTATPCSDCGYRSVCRFDRLQGYRNIERVNRAQLLNREGDTDGQS